MSYLTAREIDELSALRATCAANNGPSFLLRSHWRDTGYCRLVRRRLVVWGDPPEGFERRKFAGASLSWRGAFALEAALRARALASADMETPAAPASAIEARSGETGTDSTEGFDPARDDSTPGPWSIRWTCSGASIYDPRGRRVAYTSAPAKAMKRDEVVANAKLIASAPDIHAEIKAIEHDLERVMTRENCYLNALMLISGMRGKAAEVARRALYGDEPHQDAALATAIAMAHDSAANGDLPVPQDCQARAGTASADPTPGGSHDR